MIRATMTAAEQWLVRGFRTVLSDGSCVRLRPVRPDDRAHLIAGMAQLSSASRYFRFFTSQRELSEAQLRYFTEVDQCRHVAWVAVEDAAGPVEQGVGIGRFIVKDDDPLAAEIALTVIDARQRRGLGTLLLALLSVLAEARGVQRLEGLVLAENRAVVGWLCRIDAALRFAGGVWQASLPLGTAASPVGGQPGAARFRAAVACLRRTLDAVCRGLPVPELSRWSPRLI